MFVSRMGIDFGTANVRIAVPEKGIILREPAVAALDERTGEICAMGSAAYEMIGRAPEGIKILYPMRQGVISDYKTAGRMLKYFIKKAVGGQTLGRPRLAVCVPLGVTEVEKRAVWDAAFGAGAGQIQMIEAPIAAAIGAGFDISRPKGHLLVDIGAGVTNIAVISMNNTVIGMSVKTAGDDFDAAMIQYMKDNYQLLIGKATAGQLKMTVGSVFAGHEMEAVKVSGRSIVSGMPEVITLASAKAREALAEPAAEITAGVRHILEQTPPELAADIGENGIILTGGTSLLDGFDRLIEDASGIRTVVAGEPESAGALGAAMYLKAMSASGKKLFRERSVGYKKYAGVEEKVHTDAGVYISGKEVSESQ